MTELGSRLKEARQAKGISLDDLQNMTKIQKRYLKGIEEGNYDMMPGKFYVRAFIKQYAEAVGLEADQIFDEYKSEVPVVYNDDLPEQISRVQSRKTVSPSSSKVLDVFPKIVVAIFIIAAIALIWFLVQKYAGSDNIDKLGGSKENKVGESSTPQVKQSGEPEGQEKQDKNATKENNIDTGSDQENSTDSVEDQEKMPPQEIKVESKSGKFSTYTLSNTDKFELTIKSTGETWVQIKNGKGYSSFQGMLVKNPKENQKDTFSADFTKEDKAVITVGRTTETEIYVNDEKLEYAVSPNDSVNQIITIQFEPSNAE